jgi:hypothetical protein
MAKSKHQRKHKDKNPTRKNREVAVPAVLSSSSSSYSSSAPTESSNLAQHLPLPPAFPSHLSRPSNGFLRDEPPYQVSFRAAIEGPYEGFVVDSPQELEGAIQEDASTSQHNDNDIVRKDNHNVGRHLHKDGPGRRHDENIYLDHKNVKQSKITVNMRKKNLNNNHESYVSTALHSMNDKGEFREDVTQPFGLGTKCAKTYVTRCLVGEPGTSYKYLGVRMFSLPFQCDENTRTIQRLGSVMAFRANQHIQELNTKRRARGAPSPKGSSPSFNICLINRMVCTSDLKPTVALPSDCRDDNSLDQGKTSVSWHADSSLEHFSTIAVYQTLEATKNRPANAKHSSPSNYDNNDNTNNTWWVGLRVAHHAEGPNASSGRKGSSIEATLAQDTPPIAVSLPSGSAYYLLDDFNHHHQHIVFTTGSNISAGVRYSCTFRKLRETHNVQYWMERGNSLMKSFNKKGLKVWRAENLVSQELEFEWIRQFYIQGQRHFDTLYKSYWAAPLQELLALWSSLEQRTYQTLELLRAAAEAKCGVGVEDITTTTVGPKANSNGNSDFVTHRLSKGERKERDRRRKALSVVETILSRCENEVGSIQQGKDGALYQLYLPMAECLEEQARKRELWEKREKDQVFQELDPDCRPLPVPFRFHRAVGEVIPKACQWGSSPFPKSPCALIEMAKQVRQLGEAFDDGNVQKIPLSWKHVKSLDWGGWENGRFGLELQQPWSRAIVKGSKMIETRLYTLPPALLGKKILILETPCGKAGQSGLGNFIDLSMSHTIMQVDGSTSADQSSKVHVIGWCIFSSIKKYTTRPQFQRDQSLHLVTPDSGYGWNENGKPVYGWVVGEYGCYNDKEGGEGEATPSFSSGIRRFRSLFELQLKSGDTASGREQEQGQSSEDQSHKKKGKRRALHSNRTPSKRKRF